MKLRLIGFVAIAILATALTTLAQVGTMQGTITGKGADGKEVPVEGATVDIVRTDIKGNYTVKTDKKGNYVYTGIPIQGNYWIIVSAPGWQANAAYDVGPGRPERTDVQLVPGNGNRPTYEEIKAASAKNATGGGKPAAVDPKEEAERKKKEDEERKASENFEGMKKTFEEGMEFSKKGSDFLNKKDYSNAIDQYKQATDKFKTAASMDPTQSVIFSNMAVADKNMAAAKFNNNDKDGAQQNFKDSVEAFKQAIAILDKKPDEKDYLANSFPIHELMADALYILGERYQDQQAMKDAITEYGWLITKYGTDTKKASLAYAKIGDTLNNLGMTMSLEEGATKREEAKTNYEKALSLNPNNAKAYIGMVMLIANDPNADINKYKQGVEYAKKAKAVADPNSLEAHQADEFIKNLEDAVAAMNDAANDKNNQKKKKP